MPKLLFAAICCHAGSCHALSQTTCTQYAYTNVYITCALQVTESTPSGAGLLCLIGIWFSLQAMLGPSKTQQVAVFCSRICTVPLHVAWPTIECIAAMFAAAYHLLRPTAARYSVSGSFVAACSQLCSCCVCGFLMIDLVGHRANSDI
jgi:hypothetical protein